MYLPIIPWCRFYEVPSWQTYGHAIWHTTRDPCSLGGIFFECQFHACAWWFIHWPCHCGVANHLFALQLCHFLETILGWTGGAGRVPFGTFASHGHFVGYHSWIRQCWRRWDCRRLGDILDVGCINLIYRLDEFNDLYDRRDHHLFRATTAKISCRATSWMS